MTAFQDRTQTVDEPSSERIGFRVKPRIKRAIQRAAALSEVGDSVFIRNAAYRLALETIAAHERTLLQPVDHAAFFAALDHSPAATEKLEAAIAHHRRTVDSR